jgi:pimeloyl-ACP methyl ester carboxylesterase
MLEEKKIEKPVVIGHSIGGTLAIALAEEHSEKLSGIIAVDGLPVFPTLAYATAEQRKAMADQMAGLFETMSQADFLAAEKNYMSSVGTNRPELVEPTAELEARSDPKMAAAWMREDLMNDLRPGLNKITCRFLEIMPYDPNGGSPYTQEQTVAFYQSLIAGAKNVKVVAISPARHFAMLDQAAKFYKIVREFLQQIK